MNENTSVIWSPGHWWKHHLLITLQPYVHALTYSCQSCLVISFCMHGTTPFSVFTPMDHDHSQKRKEGDTKLSCNWGPCCLRTKRSCCFLIMMICEMDSGTSIWTRSLSLPGFAKKQAFGTWSFLTVLDRSAEFFSHRSMNWAATDMVITPSITNEFVLRWSFKERGYLPGLSRECDLWVQHSGRQPQCEAPGKCARAVAGHFVRVTGPAMALFFLVPLQQNDENNL